MNAYAMKAMNREVSKVRTPRVGAPGAGASRLRMAKWLLGVGVSSLTACGAFGPERNPPPMPAPNLYGAGSQSAAKLRVGAPPVPDWWTLYQSDALDDLVKEGLEHSPSLAAAQSTLKSAREGLRVQIGENVMPTVDVVAQPAREQTLGIPILPQETFLENVFVAQVQAKYTFDFFGASVLADRALARQVQQQAYQFQSTRRALATNIVVAVIDAASLQEQIDATTQLVALGEHRAQQMQARYARGSASRDDMLAAEQDAANAAATLPPLRAQAESVNHALATLLGRTPDRAPAPLSIDALHLPDPVPVSVPTELLHQRPDILAAEGPRSEPRRTRRGPPRRRCIRP